MSSQDYLDNEITRLQTKVDELEKGLDAAKNYMVEISEAFNICCKERDILQESEATLKVLVERLREANKQRQLTLSLDEVEEIFNSTPAQSLAAHNQKIEREAIERCAQHADDWFGMPSEVGSFIRELEGETDEN